MAYKPYYLAGKRVPGVTTFLGEDVGGLLFWANRLALEPAQAMYGMLTEEQREGFDPRTWDSNYMRDRAAEIGTLAHAMMEQHVKGTPEVSVDFVPTAEQYEAAESAFRAFLEWIDQSKIEIVDAEVRLTSTELNCGGMIDAVGRLGEKTLILDWKTSKNIYPNHILQVAAYGMIYEENNEGVVDEYHVLRFDRDTSGYFTHRRWDRYALMDVDAFSAVEEARELYETRRKIKGMI